MIAVPTLPVGVDPQVDLAAVRDRLGPEEVDVLLPEMRYFGGPG